MSKVGQRSFRNATRAALVGALLGAVSMLHAPVAGAADTGKVQGRIVTTDTGEPLGFADVLLIPADTTLRRVGTLTNADGTFLLEAAPGLYTVQIRALSYAVKRVEGLTVVAGELLPFNTALTPEAIQQEEIVVEAKARQNTEASLLAARKKAAALGDAVSAEQVRKSPDKDAAEVLRRVTGLSVSDGKYVFVRGLGERYSSTEVDGVRIASPEQNKRVVPLDLVPANLLDNIVVQKTYTADRPGEFGGGDVQVRTKDFPGSRTVSMSIGQGYVEGATFRHLPTYPGTGGDAWGFGAHFREIPKEVYQVAGNRPLTYDPNPEYGFDKATLATVGRSFRNVWSPSAERGMPNGSYSFTYGDEFRPLGRRLGVIESWSLTRGLERRDESQRLFPTNADTIYDYDVSRARQSVQLGNLSALSYRLSPRHTVHVRGLWTHSSDDEVRVYRGIDHRDVDAATGDWLQKRYTRLLYVQRDILSGTLEGRHEFAELLGLNVNWALNRSAARRQQPDRRETGYVFLHYYDGNGNLVGSWVGGAAKREFGDLKDNGWGGRIHGTVPFRLGPLGSGKLMVGYDRDSKRRQNFYRRFNFYPNTYGDYTAPPESLFSPSQYDGSSHTAYVSEGTLDQDNYRARSLVDAGFLSADVPFGHRVRGTFGVRVERGSQDVRSFDLFDPARVTAQGGFANTDWLPSGNLTWTMTQIVNVRLAASRTLSRPDLNELSPSPSIEYVGGFQQGGNPDLHRAQIDNYDVRVEAFPGLSEVLAAGFFYKRLRDPIEQTIQAGSPPILIPRNSERGTNQGVELEARFGLGRLWPRLNTLSLNANATLLSSVVRPSAGLGSLEHPLQGQAQYSLNGAMGYTSPGGRADASVLLVGTGRRLRTLGLNLPDVYERPFVSLDATGNVRLFRLSRMKLAARNLLDPTIRQLQGPREVSSYRIGRSYSIAYSYGS
jgi:outer membrane receptor protein involved in Fe transport